MENVLKKNIGILGGGQLGKMLMLFACQWDIKITVMDLSPNSPSSGLAAKFVVGDITKFNEVVQFGMQCEIICAEIESVNVAALYVLRQLGKTIYPDPDVLRVIKDKTIQKLFYTAHNIPTPSYRIFNNRQEIYQSLKENTIEFPFIQKARFGGYDGKGVVVVRNPDEIHTLLRGSCVVEPLLKLKKELSVIVFKNKGERLAFDPIEMFFHKEANLLQWQIAPAAIDDNITQKLREMAFSILEAMNFNGMLVVEFFLNEDNQLYINEVSPRPHNSGHHTIEGTLSSQYEQYLRVMLDLPLADVSPVCLSSLINILGRKDNTIVSAENLNNILSIKGAKLHIYGKADIRPYRKMGHVTVLDKDRDSLMEKTKLISKYLDVDVEIE